MGHYDTFEILLEGILECFTRFREYRTIWVCCIKVFGDGERVSNCHRRTAARVDDSRKGIVGPGWVIGFGSGRSAPKLDNCALDVRI